MPLSAAERFVLQAAHQYFNRPTHRASMGLKNIRQYQGGQGYSFEELLEAVESLTQKKLVSAYTLQMGARKAPLVAGLREGARAHL